MTAATILATGTRRRGSLALAAAVAVEAAAATGARTLLVEVAEGSRRRGATLLSTPAARELEDSLRIAGWSGSARGHLCHLALGTDGRPLDALGETMLEGGAELVVAHLPAALWVPALDSDEIGALGGLIVVELPRERSLAALAVDQLRARGLGVKVASATPSPFAARRALAGARPGGRPSSAAKGIAAALLGIGADRGAERPGERGQALPALLGAGTILIMVALLLAAIGGAVTGKGRVQRAADLAALSAARSMRDDMPRLAEPRTLPDGTLNPRRLSRVAYLSRAQVAATDAARRNGVDPRPSADRLSRPQRAAAAAGARPGERRDRTRGASGRGATRGGREPTRSRSPPPPSPRQPLPPVPGRGCRGWRAEGATRGRWSTATARGCGRTSPRPMTGWRRRREARRDIRWWSTRGFAPTPSRRSSSPGTPTLTGSPRRATRCTAAPPSSTSDPPPPTAGWPRTRLASASSAAIPGRHGISASTAVRRPARAPETRSAQPSPGRGSGAPGLPSFVPARFRDPIIRSAARWNVSPGLLAAQLMAESGFNPEAVSPAGAQGIAQFMPGTAAGYGLRDPFDPVAAIDAQAHLMSDLLRRFHSVPLALAAYNAGSGAVGACSCVPMPRPAPTSPGSSPSRTERGRSWRRRWKFG